MSETVRVSMLEDLTPDVGTSTAAGRTSGS
ncbi:MAG: hypothetical protein JWM85_1361 [Acidimicrobiaceae bacterium]|nr:hypothetical protein [Acidimicrobiaceae bacterium]